MSEETSESAALLALSSLTGGTGMTPVT
jgi:hypothetical protein